MKITRSLSAIVVLVAGLGLAVAAVAQTLPYKDPTLSVEARVKDLLGRLTLAEKCAQLNLVGQTAGVDESIPAGGMILVCGTELPAGRAPWLAPVGTYTVQAEVDVARTIAETNEANNVQATTLSAQAR